MTMSSPPRHYDLSGRLRPERRLGLPEGGFIFMCSAASGEVEAGYLWVGVKRGLAHSTVPHAGGNLNVDLDPAGRFVGLEMLRRVTDAQARAFLSWAHRTWGAREGRPHWACSALLTLRRAWDEAARRSRPRSLSTRRGKRRPLGGLWLPELAAS